MNLCIISSGDYFSDYGGGQVYVKNLVQGLHRKGHMVIVISLMIVNDAPASEIKTYQILEGLVYQIHIPNTAIDRSLSSDIQPSIEIPLKALLSELKPQIVHANGWKYLSALVCEKLSIPCIVTAHHGGIICPNGMLMNQSEVICNVPVSMENCLECALHFVPGGPFWTPVVRSLTQQTALTFAQNLNKIRNIPYVSPAFKIPLDIENKLKQIDMLKNTSVRIIAPSHAIADALKRNGIKDEKVQVIPHGIIPFEPKPLSDDFGERPLRFGYVGRIAYVKGLHVLMDALKLLPDGSKYELHIYGEAATKSETQYYQKLQKQSEELNVYWHGKISYQDIAKSYHSFDILILPSICLEVFGLTVVEALSSGRSVIATRSGGPEDILSDGIDGVLVESNDPKSLEEAMEKMIRKPEIVQKMVEKIQPVISLESHIEMLEKLYFEMIKGEK